ncbi:MAG: putative Ig domain-containing protein [Terracidiphilus sp.]
MSWKKLALVCLSLCFATNASIWITGCGGSSKPISITLTASSATVDPTDSITITAAVDHDHGSDGVTWTVSGGGTLSNTSSTSVTYTAPAPSASSFTATITATSVAETSKTATITITVPAAPSITTSSLPPATVGTAFSETLAVSGGISPYTWKLTAGTLPSCLTLTTAGALSGTPLASCTGSYDVTVEVTDSGTPNALAATEKLTIVINAAPAIVLPAPATLQAGVYNVAYTGSVAATGGAGTLTYSITGNLPTGLTLNTSTGAITGTPTAGGTFSFTIKAADAFGDSATQAYSIAITYPALSITTSSLPAGLYNTTYGPETLAATGGSGSAANLSWSATGLPAGLSLSSAGVITGKPTVTGAFSVVITVNDSVAKSSAQATLSLSVTYPTLSITTASLPNGVLNAAYPNTTLAATGGSGSSANYTWSWTAASGSSLPAGLNLSAAGLISGTPTAGGSFSVVLKVADSVSNTTATETLPLTITYPTLSVTTKSLPNGLLNAAYAPVTLAASGGSDNSSNYSWTWAAASGSSLPAGLNLSTAGILSGTPTAGGAFSVVVTVKDSVSNTSASATLALTVAYPALTIPTTALPNGILNATYTPYTLTATGGSDNTANYSWTWAAAAGSSLPPGMSLSAAGVLSGSPTSGGSYSVVLTVADSVSKTNASVTLPFTVGFTTLVISTKTLPAAYFNTAYGPVDLAATGGSGNSANYSWTWAAAAGSSLPGGLSLSSAGAITGTPTATGTFSVVVTVADSVSKTNTQATLSLSVTYAALSITTTAIPNGVLNAAYTPYTLTATGGSNTSSNYTWSWTAASGSSLPAGLALSAGGVISGTPTAGGSFSVVLKVADSVSGTNATATLPVTVTYPALSITTKSIPNGVLNAAYTAFTLAATGGSGNAANYSWTWAAASGSSLPAGLSLSAAGVITGTPTAGGSFSAVITVADSVSKTNASVTLPITIGYPTLTITTTALPNGVLNAAYTAFTLTATGGSDKTANLSWSWAAASGSSLPAGLSLSTAGVITGTPTAGGTFSVVISVADSVSKTNASVTLPITVTYPTLTITTALLPNGLLNSAYTPLTLAATGGSGNSANLSWSATGLPTGMSVSTAGVLSGTPTVGGSFSVVITVADSVSKTNASATLPLYIAYPVLSITPNSALPAGYVGVAYSAAITGSGGSGNYCYIVPTILTQASTLDGLGMPAPNATSCGGYSAPSGYGFYIGSALGISGTPTSSVTPPYNIPFNTTLIDLTTGNSVVGSYSIAITAPPALSLPTPNPVTLPAAAVGTSYTGSINATGGAGTYTWTVNGAALSAGGSANLGNGTLVASSNGNVLNISGTPSTSTPIGTPLSFTAAVSDSASQSAGPDTYTIAVNNAGAPVSGQIMLENCGGTLPTITVSINTSPVQTTTTDSNGNYSFASIPNGNYTITPSITGPESVFYPATIPISVDGTPLSNENFTAALGYTVSGNVTFGSTTPTGQVYIALNSTNCGSNSPGTSITEATLKAGGAFSIRGVQPGSYTLSAWMDALGHGAQNASDPISTSTSVTVSNANLTGQAITLTAPAAITLSSAPTIKGVSPASETALVSFGGVPMINGAEAASSYTLEWSTSSTFASVTGSESLAAVGTGGAQIWFVTGLTNGTQYYFRVQGVAGSSTSPFSSIYGPVTIDAPSGGNAVSGTVTFSETATGPLYVGFYNTSTGEVYATAVGSKTSPPVSPASYNVNVPTGSNYYFFGIIDQNNDNQVDPGDITNVNLINNTTVIGPTTTTQDLTMPSGNSVAQLTTQASQFNNNGTISYQYNLAFKVQGNAKLPVAVTLASGANVLVPADYGLCTSCGNTQEFNFYVSLYSFPPVTGNPYGLLITYSDGTSETLTPTVGNILSAYATDLLPDSTGASLTPTFTWTDPANASDYTYQFQLTDQNGNTIWQIPGQNSNSNGFASTITSITYGTDPTGGGSTPTLTQLATGTTYTWWIQVDDANQNQATTQVQFTTTGTAPFTLPAPDPSSLGPATVGQSYNGSITASGGVANYTWTVNGTAVNPSGCTLLSIGDGLSVCNSNGSSTLSVAGTPTTAEVVSFTASITDSTNTTDSNGTLTYTVTVNSANPLTLPNPSTNVGSALVGYAYGATLGASGGTGSGYVFTLNGTALPTNGTHVSIGNGLSAYSAGGATFYVTGTPTSTTAVTFTLSVKDSSGDTDTGGTLTYTIDVSNPPSSTNNSNLSGQYVCSAGGFVDSDGTLWKTMFSLQANGSAGTFTNGVFDSNGTDYAAAETGTVTGTFGVGSDNNGVATLTFNPTGSSSLTFKVAIALTNAVEPAQEFSMIEIDDLGATPSGRTGQGTCYLATTSAFTSATVSGHSFVYLADGETSTPAPRTSIARFTTSSGSVTGGVIDQAVGIPATVNHVTLTGGSYTLPASPSFTTTGRYTLALTSSAGTANFVVYIIDSARMFIMQTDAATGSFGGNVRTQQQTTYSAANVDSNMVVYFQGLDASGGSLSGYNSSVFQASGNGAGNLTINESYQDDSGTYSVGGANGTYALTFDTTNPGRVTFVPGSGTAYLYLYNNNAAGLLVVDGSGDLYGGFIDPQTQTTFTDAALAGTYMFSQFSSLKSRDVSVGELAPASNGDVTGGLSTGGEGAFDYDSPETGLTYSWLSTTYGTISVADNGVVGYSCIDISSTKFVCIQNTKALPVLQVFQQ